MTNYRYDIALAFAGEDRQLAEALAENLCRCGNYNRITESVVASVEMMRGGA